MPYQKLRNFAQLIRDHLNLGLDRGSHLPNYPVFPGHRSAQNGPQKRPERATEAPRTRGKNVYSTHGTTYNQASEVGRRNPLEVWPESHWPGFALRQSDVFQFYAAQ